MIQGINGTSAMQYEPEVSSVSMADDMMDETLNEQLKASQQVEELYLKAADTLNANSFQYNMTMGEEAFSQTGSGFDFRG